MGTDEGLFFVSVFSSEALEISTEKKNKHSFDMYSSNN